MRGWGKVLFSVLAMASLFALKQVDLKPSLVQAQTGSINIDGCQDILQNLQIANQSTNPVSATQCRDDVVYYDSLHGQWITAVMVVVEFPKIRDLYLEYQGEFRYDFSAAGWYECNRTNQSDCYQPNNLILTSRYQYDQKVSQWLSKAALPTGGPFSNFFRYKPCATNGSTYQGRIGNSGGGVVNFSCQTVSTQIGDHWWVRFDPLNIIFRDPKRLNDVTDQRLLIFERNTTTSIGASPDHVKRGEASALTWSADNATTGCCTITPDVGSVVPTGTIQVHPTAKTTYTFTVNRPGSTTTKTATVYIVPTITSFTANPPSTTPSAGSTLSWATLDATSASISPDVGNVPVNGEIVVRPTQTTTYTLTATNPDGQTTAKTTVCVFGGTSFRDGVVDRVYAAECAAPDLVPDLTNIEIDMTDDTGKTFTKRPPNIVYGREIVKMTIKNIVIKNQGQAVFDGDLVIGFNVIGNMFGSDTPDVKLTKRLRITAGQSVTLDPMPFLIENEDDKYMVWSDMKAAAFFHNKTSLDYSVFVDPDNLVVETNEINNRIKISNFMSWAAIKAHAQFDSDGKPADLIDFGFFLDGANTGASAISDKQGNAWFVPTKRPTAKYNIEADWGNVTLSDKPVVTVSASQIYTATVKIKGLYAVRAETFIDIGDFAILGPASRPLVPDEGKITIVSAKNAKTSFTAPIVNGIAVFSGTETPGFKPGQYKPLDASNLNYPSKMQARINYKIYWEENGQEKSKDTSVLYSWPESSRAQELPKQNVNDPANLFDFSTKPIYGLQMVLPINCDSQTYPTFTICISDSRIGDTMNSHSEIVNAVMNALKPMKAWKTSPVKTLDRIVFGVDPDADYAAYYKNDEPTVIVIEGRGATAIYPLAPNNVINSAIHETFHHLDDYYETDVVQGGYYFLSNRRAAYKERLKQQFNTQTGQKIWDLISDNCAFTNICDAGYPAKSILQKLRIPVTEDSAFIESLAEDKSTLCTYKNRVVNRLNNVNGELTTLWQAKYNEPLPNDYPQVRDNILARWQGIDLQGGVAIQPFADWYSNCRLTK